MSSRLLLSDNRKITAVIDMSSARVTRALMNCMMLKHCVHWLKYFVVLLTQETYAGALDIVQLLKVSGAFRRLPQFAISV